MESNPDQTITSVEPWWASLLGALYFLLAGVGLMLQEMPPAWVESARLRPVDWLIIVNILIPAIGLAAGWALGFPRWSYPCTGGLFMWSLYLMGISANTAFTRFLIGTNQNWGWRVWIPFLLACAVGFLLTLWVNPTPSSGRGEGRYALSPGVRAHPHFLFLSNLRQDPSLASYAMFGWMPLLLFIAFDEVDRLYTTIFILIFTVLMIATALLYQRLRKPQSRLRALVAGVLACVLLIEIAIIAYLLPVNGVNIPLSLLWGVIILAILLYPILFTRRATPAQGAEQNP